MVYQEPQDLLVLLDPLVPLASQDPLELQETLGHQEEQDPLDPLASLDLLVSQEIQEALVQRDALDPLDLPVYKEIRVVKVK
jgi:hypothetical protein